MRRQGAVPAARGHRRALPRPQLLRRVRPRARRRGHVLGGVWPRFPPRVPRARHGGALHARYGVIGDARRVQEGGGGRGGGDQGAPRGLQIRRHRRKIIGGQ